MNHPFPAQVHYADGYRADLDVFLRAAPEVRDVAALEAASADVAAALATALGPRATVQHVYWTLAPPPPTSSSSD